jgi:hypothetical protein
MRWFLFLWCALPFWCTAVSAADKPSRPNIVLIMADDK